MRILYVSARFPYPPLRGDQVRAYHQLRLLGPKHRITLLSFTDKGVTADARQTIEKYCERVITLPLHLVQMARSLLQRAFSAYPLQTTLYQTADMKNAVRNALTAQAYDLVHVQLARMAPYLESENSIPRVIDLIDSLSLNMKRRYERDRSPLKWAAYLEWKRLDRYERRICQMYNRVTVVSPVDLEAIGSYPNVTINTNGVDLTQFSFLNGDREQDSLVFSGNMGYFPNVNAVLWFAKYVLPLIKASVPDVKFYVVGARPARPVRELAEQDPAIIVTGFVKNLSEYLKRAMVAVVPLQAGSGQQFKVIEAMACGTPLVVTPFALGGIEAINNEHLLVASNPDMFTRLVIRLLHDRALARRLTHKARQLVEEKYSWEHSVSDLEAIYHSVASN